MRVNSSSHERIGARRAYVQLNVSDHEQRCELYKTLETTKLKLGEVLYGDAEPSGECG